MSVRSIFILGLHRSGTTFANLVIGAHPDCVAVGEVYNVIRPDVTAEKLIELYQHCTCGQCEFWPQVIDAIGRDGASSLTERYRVFGEVFARNFPGKFPVDSSKRIDVIEAAGQALQVSPVMVYRDVRGWSYSKVGRIDGRTMLGWYRGNRRIETRFPEAIPVSYESLALESDKAIPALFDKLGLPPCEMPIQLDQPHAHILIGNKMRGKKGEGIRYDQRWMADNSLWPAVLAPVMRYNRKRIYQGL